MKAFLYGDTVYQITEKQYNKIKELQDRIETAVGYYGHSEVGEKELQQYVSSINLCKKITKIDISYTP